MPSSLIAIVALLLIPAQSAYTEEPPSGDAASSDSGISMGVVAEKYKEAEELRNVGRNQKALEIYRELSAEGINYPELHVKRSNTLFRLGKKEEALEALELALEVQPKDAELWFNKGVILYSMEDYPAAIEAYNTSITLNPRDEVAWHNKGLALNRLGQHQYAADAYNTALGIKSDYFTARYNHFLSQVASGQYRLAAKLIDGIVREYPDRLQAHLARGQFLMTQKEWEKAEASFHVAVSFNPEVASLWRKIAICRAQMGNYEAAIESYEKALVLKPSWDEVREEKKSVELLMDRAEGSPNN